MGRSPNPVPQRTAGGRMQSTAARPEQVLAAGGRGESAVHPEQLGPRAGRLARPFGQRRPGPHGSLLPPPRAITWHGANEQGGMAGCEFGRARLTRMRCGSAGERRSEGTQRRSAARRQTGTRLPAYQSKRPHHGDRALRAKKGGPGTDTDV